MDSTKNPGLQLIWERDRVFYSHRIRRRRDSPVLYVNPTRLYHSIPNRSRSKQTEYLPERPLSCINIRYTTFLFDLFCQWDFNNTIALKNNVLRSLDDRDFSLVISVVFDLRLYDHHVASFVPNRGHGPNATL